MKQADLEARGEYAYLTGNQSWGQPPAAARVQLVGTPAGGRVEVKVLDPGPPSRYGVRQRLRKGGRITASTRDLACPWAEWPSYLERVIEDLRREETERERRRREAEAAAEAEARIDPARPLPRLYDERTKPFVDDAAAARVELGRSYAQASDLGPFAVLADLGTLLEPLPSTLRRDLLAALTVRHRPVLATLPEDAVGRVLADAVAVLDHARLTVTPRERGASTPRLDGLVDAAWVAFLAAVDAEAADRGEDMGIPRPLPYPASARWDDGESAVLSAWGWARTALGDTTGEKLHNIGCPNAAGSYLDRAETRSWWDVTMADASCGVCGGPGTAHPVALAHLAAAVSVWDARGRGPIERWQYQALGRFVGASVADRIGAGEAERTLAMKVTEALNQLPTDSSLSDAMVVAGSGYYWNLPKFLQEMPDDRRERARATAIARLNALTGQLPGDRAPAPLPSSADTDAVAARYAELRKQDFVNLDGLLFGS